MKKTTQFLTALAISALFALPASADIAWQSSVNMYQGSTVETFVDTTGTLAVAYNNTPDTVDGNTTVNGVAFQQAFVGSTLTGVNGESITINGGSDNASAFGDGEFSGNGNIFHLIRGGTFEVQSITLGGLQIGHEYLIQSFNNDARASRSLNSVTGYGDGTGSGPMGFSELNNSPVDGSAPTFPETEAGDSIIGTFIADSATETFIIYGSTGGLGGTFTSGNGAAQINAIQLRDLGQVVPEPSSVAILSLCSLVLLKRRRK